MGLTGHMKKYKSVHCDGYSIPKYSYKTEKFESELFLVKKGHTLYPIDTWGTSYEQTV